jgi:hypothetical protein
LRDNDFRDTTRHESIEEHDRVIGQRGKRSCQFRSSTGIRLRPASPHDDLVHRPACRIEALAHAAVINVSTAGYGRVIDVTRQDDVYAGRTHSVRS